MGVIQMPRGQAKTYEPLELSELADAGLVTDPNEAQKLAPPKRGYTASERTAEMKQFDQWVTELYAAWVKAGKPSDFTKSPMRKVPVKANKVATVKFLATKAAGYVSKQTGTPMSVQFGQDGVKLRDGRHVVSFRVTDPRRVSKTNTPTAS